MLAESGCNSIARASRSRLSAPLYAGSAGVRLLLIHGMRTGPPMLRIAAGLPVLARKTGNHARFGTSGIVRFIDDPDSPHASLTLRALLEGPSVYAGMRRKSAWRIRNWRDVGHEWAKLIEEHSWT